MRRLPKSFAPALLLGLTLSGCSRKEEPVPPSGAADTQPGATAAPAPPSSSPTGAAGFDINKVPVVNPQLGKFPYVGLIEGYQRSKQGTATSGSNKEVAFDRYEFFDGAKLIPVEGRLTTIEAEGQGASAFQVFKTYESLVTGLGGVKVFEGEAEKMNNLKLEFRENRHRQPVYDGDQMGVYVLRTPEKEIWFQAYVGLHGKEGTYFLTVVEKQALEVKASLLPAEEMKKELDAKGHVALYINFDFNKADIKPDSQPIIEQILKLLKNNPGLKLAIKGHTDNVGTPAYNKQLSDARARSVMIALTAQGVEAQRLTAAGFGQERPVADNSTDDGRAKNRRVELVKIK